MSAHELTNRRLAALEKKLSYAFERRELLVTALTHSSWANERREPSTAHYERMEFLGDSVLGLAIADLLYRRGTDEEGTLTLAKVALVSAPTLSALARELKLGSYLRLGQGEELCGGRDKPSILADVLEAVIGAIYLDGGYPAARRFVRTHFAARLQEAGSGSRRLLDYKSALQEILQAARLPPPTYAVVDESGPAHQRTFTVILAVLQEAHSSGVGSTKKAAEQEAARKFLEEIESGAVSLAELAAGS